VLRYRHAELWLEGHRCRRSSGTRHNAARARFDKLREQYAGH
jgi:hypothetical protein